MQTVRSIRSSIPLQERLSLRLALLFFGAFFGVLIVIILSTLFGAIGDRSVVSADSDVQAPVIVIDPKIQSDLAKAMSFDAIPATVEVHNPFIDRAGIGSNITVTAASSTANVQRAAAGVNVSGSGSAGGPSRTSITQVPPSLAASLPEAYDARARYDDWLNRQRRGEFVVPESEILAVEDLVPVGFASGGSRGDEVILYSVSLCRTFSFPVGTHFYNGWLNEINQQEVVFVFQNGLLRKSYSDAQICDVQQQMSAQE